jgi:hypothetical protein
VEDLLDIGVALLRLVPSILAFYIPALIGMAIWSERGEGYKVKALLWFAIGFGLIIALQVVITGASALQAATLLALSLVQVGVALSLAALTVYKLADSASPRARSTTFPVPRRVWVRPLRRRGRTGSAPLHTSAPGYRHSDPAGQIAF